LARRDALDSNSSAEHLVIRQSLHNAEQFALRLETDAGNLRKPDVAVLDRYSVGKPTERLKDSRIGFVASQSQTGGDVQRHLMPSVRNTVHWRPSIFLQRAENSEVFNQAVAQSAIELQNVAIRTQLRVANEISGVLHGE